jgi:uncharacterized protein YciI
VATNMPSDVALEPVWVIEATYSEDAAERRAPVRGEHLERAASLRDAGTIIEVGAFADMTGSLLVLRAPDEEAALDVCREDVYWRTGVWTTLTARRFSRVVRPAELAGP